MQNVKKWSQKGETIGDHLVSFPANSQTRNPVTLLLIANY
jgi:hypothetical protein